MSSIILKGGSNRRPAVARPYSTERVAGVKTIPRRRWHPEDKCWRVPNADGHKPTRLPVVMTREEVKAVLGCLQAQKWVMASLMYGAGLRLMECVQLWVQDIDFARNESTVRYGKGAKDGAGMLP